MSRKLALTDRTITLVVAAAAIVCGLALLDWQFQLIFDWPKTANATAAADIVSAGWFVWVFAGTTVVLGLLGVWWLIAHVPRPEGRQLRTESQDASGAVKVDVSSLADAAAERFARLAPVLGASGSAKRIGGIDVVQIRARVDARTSADRVIEVAEQTQRDLAGVSSQNQPTLRILLDAPSRVALKPKSSGPPKVR